MELHAFGLDIIDWLRHSGIRIIFVIAGALVTMWAARFVINRLFSHFSSDGIDGEMQKRAQTLRALIRWAVNSTLLAVCVIMVLQHLGIEIGPILAAAGIVGIAVGFGSQQLVQDIISGFFILMEDQIRVGDVVEVAGKSGLVERVTLRMVILRDLAGNVHFVRNGHIDVVTNMTKKYSYCVFDVGVAYRENVDDVIAILKQVGETMQRDEACAPDILEPLEIFGLDRFEDSSVVIKARFKTQPSRQWGIAREFNRRLKAAFDERGIEIPFPHLTVYMGQPKRGEAPPLNVAMTKSNEKSGQT